MAKKLPLSINPPRRSEQEREQAQQALEARMSEFTGEAPSPVKEREPLTHAAEEPAGTSVAAAAEARPRQSTTIYVRAGGQGRDYRTTIYFPLQVHEILKAYCAAERTNVSQLVTSLVTAHLEEIGSLEDSASFMAAYYAAKPGKGKH